MSKRFVTGLVLSLALALAAPAAAQQRPLVTEDPETIGSGLILFEGGFDLGQEIFYPVSGLQGDLLRLPTLGLSFGLSSIAELQIDGGIYNRLKVTDRIRGAAVEHARFHRRHDQRLRGHRRGDQGAAAVGDGGPAGGRRPLCHQAAEREQRERHRAGHHRLLRDAAHRQDRSVGPPGRQCRARHSRRSDPRRSSGRRAAVRLLGRARRAAGRRDRRRDQRTPAAAGRRDRPAGNRHPRGHARRRPLHASHRAIRRRHHPGHDVAGPELRLHRRADLGLPRVHVFPDGKGEGRREKAELIPFPFSLLPCTP